MASYLKLFIESFVGMADGRTAIRGQLAIVLARRLF